MSRGSPAPPIAPKLPVPTVESGSPKCAWLKKLNDSKRNSKFARSPREKFLYREKSRLTVPGPSRIFRPEFPNRGTPAANAACKAVVEKQDVLNQLATVCRPSPGQMRSGRGLV